MSKINQLMQSLPYGTVFLSSWLTERGYSPELQKRYRSSKWLESIGTGAMIRSGDHVNLEGALYALQNQLNLSIHIGGKSALAMLGRSHYLELGNKEMVLFGHTDEKLPQWFNKYNWATTIKYYPSGFLPANLGLAELEVRDFKVKLSNPVRAMMECLYLAPQQQPLMECYELLEGLNNLRPAMVQEMLESCNSVKVKRLFLFMAEKAGHSWTKHLKADKIDLGKGKRSIAPGGVYIPKYEITVPKELAAHGTNI